MATATNFTATDGALKKPVRGEPWGRSIRLVDGKDVWSSLGGCEARMQVRQSAKESSRLLFDMTPHLTLAYGTGGEANDIRVSWSLTGEQTRNDLQPGYYDLFISDTGTTDVRSIRLIFGELAAEDAVTSAEGSV